MSMSLSVEKEKPQQVAHYSHNGIYHIGRSNQTQNRFPCQNSLLSRNTQRDSVNTQHLAPTLLDHKLVQIGPMAGLNSETEKTEAQKAETAARIDLLEKKAERDSISILKETLILQEVLICRMQQLAITLAKPLIEVARNHLLNMILTEEYIKQIRYLRDQRTLPKKTILVLVPKRLNRPQTVCKKCSVWRKTKYAFHDIPIYKVCHDECYLEVSPQYGECAAYYRCGTFSDFCTVCGCHKSYHDHQFYENEVRAKTVVDVWALEYHDAAQRGENIRKLLEEEMDKYKRLETENNLISDYWAEATVSVLEDAVNSEGDPHLLQLQSLLRDEESKMEAGGDSELYLKLLTLFEKYRDTVKHLQRQKSAAASCEELIHKIGNLTRLLHCGQQVKKLLDLCEQNVMDRERKIKGEGASPAEKTDKNAIFGVQMSPKSNLVSNNESNGINILLLGEIGVGKTTFINSLVNNLKHKSLQGMLQAMPQLLADAAFTLTDEDFKTIRVTFQANCADQNDTSFINERVNDKGEATTEAPVIYNLNCENSKGERKLLNIIDTPGLSDTRGEKKDRENFEKILTCIKKLGGIHAICIMMKPNQSQFSLSFKNNIQSILIRLHQDIAKNVLLCFTNTRSTFLAGDTLTTLQCYLEKLKQEKQISIKADKNNIHCFDNACFRYLLGVKKGVYKRTEELDTMFSDSWEKNVTESKKFLANVERLPIINVKNTSDSSRTVQLVIAMAKPLIEIARSHLLNMRYTEEYIKQIKYLRDQQYQIKKTVVVFEPKMLNKPSTTCRKCTLWRKSSYGDYDLPVYKVCDSGVLSPLAYGSNCAVCGCHKDDHEYQIYRNELRRKEVTDIWAFDECDDIVQKEERKKRLLEEEKEQYKNLEYEHDSIKAYCAEATVFLLENDVKLTKDPYQLQIENLISEEESKMKLGGDPGMYYELSALLEQYKTQVESVREDIRQSRKNVATCDELLHKLDNLALLPNCGEQLKQLRVICENISNIEAEHPKEPSESLRM